VRYSANCVSNFDEFTCAQVGDEEFEEVGERQVGSEIRSQIREGQSGLFGVSVVDRFNRICRAPAQ
jgi:hypothetical protein